MKKLFVPYELMLKLEAKGFDEECLGGYKNNGLIMEVVTGNKYESFTNNNYDAPLFQQVIDWFRTKHKIHVAASSFPIYNNKYGYQYSRSVISNGWSPHFEGETYYDALTKAIEESLKLI